MADPVGPGSDADAMAAMRAALGVQDVPRAAPAKKVPAKKATKKVAARKQAAKKVPRAKPSKKVAAKKAVAVRAEVPEEVINPEIVEPALPEVIARTAAEDLMSPARRAHDLYVAGRSWDEIAVRTGYASAATASAAVGIWLQRGAISADLETHQARAAQALAVTQAVKSAYFDRAMAGDLDAAKIVLKANEDFFEMAGLGKGDVSLNAKQMIVIGGGADMGAELRAAAERADEERRRADNALGMTEVGDEVG